MLDPRRIPVPLWSALIALLAASTPAWTHRAWAKTDETAVKESSSGGSDEDLDEDADAEMGQISDPDQPITEEADSAEQSMDADPDADEAEMEVEEDAADN